MATYIWVSMGSGDSLLPDGTKLLPETKLTPESNFMTSVLIRYMNENKDCLDLRYYLFKIAATSPRCQWDNSYCAELQQVMSNNTYFIDLVGTVLHMYIYIYCKVSYIRRTKSQNLNASRLIL